MGKCTNCGIEDTSLYGPGTHYRLLWTFKQENNSPTHKYQLFPETLSDPQHIVLPCGLKEFWKTIDVYTNFSNYVIYADIKQVNYHKPCNCLRLVLLRVKLCIFCEMIYTHMDTHTFTNTRTHIHTFLYLSIYKYVHILLVFSLVLCLIFICVYR